MDASATSPIPSPVAAWSHAAAPQMGPDPSAQSGEGTATTSNRLRQDEAEELRDRLLKMIVANEMARKIASEPPRPR